MAEIPSKKTICLVRRQGIVGKGKLQTAMGFCKKDSFRHHPFACFKAVIRPLQVEIAKGTSIPPAAPGEFDRQHRNKELLWKNLSYLPEIGYIVRVWQVVEGNFWYMNVCSLTLFTGKNLLRQGLCQSAKVSAEMDEEFLPLSANEVVNMWKIFEKGGTYLAGA